MRVHACVWAGGGGGGGLRAHACVCMYVYVWTSCDNFCSADICDTRLLNSHPAPTD